MPTSLVASRRKKYSGGDPIGIGSCRIILSQAVTSLMRVSFRIKFNQTYVSAKSRLRGRTRQTTEEKIDT